MMKAKRQEIRVNNMEEAQALFQISMKLNDHLKTIKIYANDTFQSIATRFCEVNGLTLEDQHQVKIRRKILGVLEAMVEKSGVQVCFREKIMKLLYQLTDCPKPKPNKSIKSIKSTKTLKQNKILPTMLKNQSINTQNKEQKQLQRQPVSKKQKTKILVENSSKNEANVQQPLQNQNKNKKSKIQGDEQDLIKAYGAVFEKSKENKIKQLAKQMLEKKQRQYVSKITRNKSYSKQIILNKEKNKIEEQIISKQILEKKQEKFQQIQLPKSHFQRNYSTSIIRKYQYNEHITSQYNHNLKQSSVIPLKHHPNKNISNQYIQTAPNPFSIQTKYNYLQKLNETALEIGESNMPSRRNRSLDGCLSKRSVTTRSYGIYGPEPSSRLKFDYSTFQPKSTKKIVYAIDGQNCEKLSIKQQPLLMRHRYQDNDKTFSLSKYNNIKKYKYLNQ